MTKKGETFFEVIMQPETKKRKQNVAEDIDTSSNGSTTTDKPGKPNN